MKISLRSAILIIIGMLVIIVGVRAFTSSGKLSADVQTQTEIIKNYSEE